MRLIVIDWINYINSWKECVYLYVDLLIDWNWLDCFVDRIKYC